MIFEPLPLAGAYRIRLAPAVDDRGFFARRFCARTFAGRGLETDFVERSISFNRRRGTLRGLHIQAPPHIETKIVRCTRGAVFDVIVDLRAGSQTYGRWHGEEIVAEEHLLLYIPKGLAHGFQTLVDDTEIDYEITPAYAPESTCGIRFDDAAIDIAWPLEAKIVSQRDESLPSLSELAHKFK